MVAIALVLIFALTSIPEAQQMPSLPEHWVYKLDMLSELALAERRATHEVVLIQFAVPVQLYKKLLRLHVCMAVDNSEE